MDRTTGYFDLLEAFQSVLAPRGRRAICRVFAETEEMLIQTILAVLPQPTFRDAYAASSGLCLPHLRRALPQVEEEGLFAILRDAAIDREELLVTQLREIIRRHDYRFRDEPVGPERGAAERTLNHVIGIPGVPCEAQSQ